MPFFTNRKGRSYSIDVTVHTIKRVKVLMDFDLLDSENLIRRIQDPIFVCDLLYCVCKDQADTNGVSDEDFGREMSGDAILQGRNAFLEAFANFIPDPKGREIFRELVKKINQIGDRIIEATAAHMEPILKKLDAEAENVIRNVLGELPNESGD